MQILQESFGKDTWRCDSLKRVQIQWLQNSKKLVIEQLSLNAIEKTVPRSLEKWFRQDEWAWNALIGRRFKEKQSENVSLVKNFSLFLNNQLTISKCYKTHGNNPSFFIQAEKCWNLLVSSSPYCFPWRWAFPWTLRIQNPSPMASVVFRRRWVNTDTMLEWIRWTYFSFWKLLPSGIQIISGSVSAEGDWPWMVSVRKNGKLWCGATLIGENWVLTAAHCADVPEDQELRLFVSSVLRLDGQEIKLVNSIIHPGWEFSKGGDDIALFKVSILSVISLFWIQI